MKKVIIIILMLLVITPLISAEKIKIYNKEENKLIIEDDIIIRIPKTITQISPQKTRAGFSIASQSEIQTLQGQIIPWGVERVRAPQVWNKTQGETIKVAILDSGINYEHPDLNVAGGFSFVGWNESDYMDYEGHGSAVAGVVGAVDNGFGVVGVAPEVELYSVRVMNESWGFLSDILEGINWSIENEMNIISMSFGTPTYSESLEYMLDKAYDSGIILVAASGNEAEGVWYPAKYENVIAVGNTDESNQLAPSSNFGPEIELVAPGTNIVSTYLNDWYVLISGTSLSAPHVTGIVALILGRYPDLSVGEIREKLRRDAVDLGVVGRDDLFGFGLAQVNLEDIEIVNFSISPSLNFGTVRPGRNSSVINSTITVGSNTNVNFSIDISLINDSDDIFSNVYFDLDDDSLFEVGERLNRTLGYEIATKNITQIINIASLLAIPKGSLSGQNSGEISYTITGEA